MLWTLVKKELFQLFHGFFVSRKDGKKRPLIQVLLMLVAYAGLIYGLIGMAIGEILYELCCVMVDLNVSWFYWLVVFVMTVVFGVIGTAFTTHATLYAAKDNDFLLSMPIDVRAIISSRLVSVYLMGLMFSLLMMGPAAVVYNIIQDVSLVGVLGSVFYFLMASFLILALSCLLGWCVAWVSGHIKNKSVVHVVTSLVILGLYYYFYFQLIENLQKILTDMVLFATKIKESSFVLYAIGSAPMGNVWGIGILLLLNVVVLGAVWKLVERGFFLLSQQTKSSAKKVYVSKKMHVHRPIVALWKRELHRLASSATYMLNCGMGCVMMVLFAGALVFIGNGVLEELALMFGSIDFYVGVFAGCVLCFCSQMTTFTAPSISLEGKYVWILQSLPVSIWDVLKAKLLMHLTVSGIPLVVSILVCGIVLQPNAQGWLVLVLLPVAALFMSASLGLLLNLKWHSFSWTSEVKPVKQSISVFLVSVLPMVYWGMIGFVFYQCSDMISFSTFVWIVVCGTVVLSILLLIAVRIIGVKMFERLSA